MARVRPPDGTAPATTVGAGSRRRTGAVDRMLTYVQALVNSGDTCRRRFDALGR